MTIRPLVAVAVTTMTVAGAVSLLWQQPPVCPAAAAHELIESARSSRVRPRWVGCFDIADGRATDAPLVTPMQTRGAVAQFELSWAVRTRESASNFAAALALAGDPSRAIEVLQTTTEPLVDPDTLSNLAAAHLVRATATDSALDRFLALDFTGQALALRQDHRAAIYNQALALTELHLDDEADRVWRRYLELDGDSEWGDAARRQLADPERHRVEESLSDAVQNDRIDAAVLKRICQASLQSCREQIETVLLPEWARAHRAGETDRAGQRLSVARALASTLKTLGDGLDDDVVADIEQATRSQERRLEGLSRGLAAYGDAAAAFENDAPALPLYREAEEQLRTAASPMEGWARANRIYTEFNTYDAARMESLGPGLAAWGEDAGSRGYLSLSGRVFYLAALTFANRSQYAAAEPLYTSSTKALTAAQQGDYLSATHISMASSRLRIGDRREGWGSLARSLGDIQRTASPLRRYIVLDNVGTLLATYGIDHAAIRVLSMAMQVGGSAGNIRVGEAALNRAKALSRIGAQSRARADLAFVRSSLTPPAQGSAGNRGWYEYQAAVAEVESASVPRDAVEPASSALTFFESRSFGGRVATMHLIRGRAFHALGEIARARDDFAQGIDTYERYRSLLPSAQQRAASQQVVYDLYEEQLEAYVSDPGMALEVTERGRARTLLEMMRASSAPSIDPETLRAQLLPHQRVLYFAVARNELLLWVIAPDGTSLYRTAVGRQSLEALAKTFEAQLAGNAPEPDWRPTSERLFELLVAPALDRLPTGTSLIVVPDGAIHHVPFAALRDPHTGRFLVESHAIAMTPSATVLAELLSMPAAALPPARVLVVDSPTTANDLPVLSGAGAEADAIARLYPAVERLDHERATKTAFLVRLPDADVVHFAGHAIASPEYPLLAHLELAADPGDPSSHVDADEIAALHLRNTRVVVLAACETAVGEIQRGEGVASLARPFLIAGVPAIVASFWDISDQATPAFMTALHARLASGAAPAAALRDAQLASMRTLPPAVWAAFVVIGNPGP